MPNQQLIDYIKRQLAAGVSRDVIANTLIAQGWKAEDITQAFLKTTAQPSTPTSQPVVTASTVNNTPTKRKSTLFVILAIILGSVVLGGGGYAAYKYILYSLDQAQQQALDAKAQAEADQQQIDQEINNVLNGTASSSVSFTNATSTAPTASSTVTYDSTWTTFSYQSKSPRFPSFSFKYPASLGKPVVDDSNLSSSNDNFAGPIHVVFHAQHSDDTTAYSYNTDHALKNLELTIVETYTLPASADKTLPMLQSMAKYYEDNYQGASYYFTLGVLKAAGIRYSIKVTSTTYYSTQFEIDLNKQPPELFGLTISDGNALSAPKYNTDFDSSHLSTADKIARSISF